MSSVPEIAAGPPSEQGRDLGIRLELDQKGGVEALEINGRTVEGFGAKGTPDIAPEPGEAWDRFLFAVGDLWRGFIDHLPLLAIAAAVLILMGLLAKLARGVLRRVLGRTQLRAGLRELFAQLSYVGVWVLAVLVAAVIVFPDFTFGQVLATAGLASIAIGFAFKDIFENFFAGVLILWRFPFETGDYIMVEGEERLQGEVMDTWIRMTLLRTVTDELIVVPNSTLYKNAVRVLTWRDRRRQEIMVGVAYGEDVDMAREVIARAVKSCSTVDARHQVQVFARAFGESSLDFEVAWWSAAKPLDVRASRDEVVAAIKRELDREGVEIPFPYRTLMFKEKNPLHVEGEVGRRAGATHDAAQ